ncbi:MAG: choice-of-anchor Q domain-containing protein, partial [Planctomycetota bacterium]
NAGPSNTCALLVAKGTYAGATIEMKEHVDMYGGYNASGWDRDIFANKSMLDGQLARRVMVAADNCTLDGFVITRGRVGGGRGLDIHYNYDHTGCGAGIAVVGVSPIISNCVFTDNMTTRPVPWNPKPIKKDYDDDDGWHQTANDGGAISIFDHASPVIANNIFYENRTEVGRGAAVSCNYYCNPVITNNVMLGNIASTNDPMRSGDGGAINAYEYGYVVIQNNIVANNKAGSRGDGGGLAVHWWVSALVKDNVIVNNVGGDDGGGIFMAGQKHHWEPDEPQPPYPEYKIHLDGNVLMGNKAENSPSDAVRFTKLGVAEFTNNVIVDHSKGLYFQNSTVDLFNNTIGGKARTENDKPYKSNPRCSAYNNILLDGSFGSGSNNYEGDPGLVKDGFTVSGSATFDSARYLTTVVVSGANYTPGALRKRVVVSGRTWSAIKDNTSDTILVWGNVGGSSEVKNSYHISSNAARAIDKGTNSVAPDHDMDGQTRPDGSGTVDIGADEYWEGRIGPAD